MKPPPEFAEEGRESVAALLSTSAKTLSDPAYEALLGCGSLHAASTTPELLALALRRDEDETESALIELQKRGLTDRQAEPGSDVVSYRLHDLVYSFARANTNLRATTVMQAGQQFLTNHQRDFGALDAEIANLLGSVQTAQYEDAALFVKMMSQLSVGDAYYLARGHSPRSLTLLVRASEAALTLGDSEAAHYLYARLGDTYRVLYADYDRALEAYQKALALARDMGDKHRETILLSVIGIVRFHQQKEDADDYLAQAYQIAQNHEDDFALSQIFEHQGYIAGHREDWEKTRELSQKAVDVAARLKKKLSETSEVNQRLFFSLLNLGEAERQLGNFEDALTCRQEALGIATEERNQLWMAHAHLELAEMYQDHQQPEQARPHFEKALALYRANNAQAYVTHIEAIFQPAEGDISAGKSRVSR